TITPTFPLTPTRTPTSTHTATPTRTPTPTPTSTAMPQTEVWRGSTNRGKGVSFKLAPDGTSVNTFTFTIPFSYLSCSEDQTFTLPRSSPVLADTFRFTPPD